MEVEATIDDEVETGYQVRGLYCTLCDHGMNSYYYLICTHPFVRSPLCLPCSDEIEERLTEAGMHMPESRSSTPRQYINEGGDTQDYDADNETKSEPQNTKSHDVCTWCGSTPGELIMCGDGTQCPHSFCRDCLSYHLGANVMREIDSADTWQCLVCDGSPSRYPALGDFAAALEAGLALSMYTRQDQNDMHESDDDMPQSDLTARSTLNLLHEVLEAMKDAEDKLEEAAEKKSEIEEEIMEEHAGCDDAALEEEEVHARVAEEMRLHVARQQRQLDIMARQEIDLIEILDRLDYDAFRHPIYAGLGNKCAPKDDHGSYELGDAEMECAREVDRFLDERDRGSKSSNGGASSSSSFGKIGMERCSINHDWYAEIDHREEQKGNLESLKKETGADPLVQLYAAREPLPDNYCPPSFYSAWPADLLKALHHASKLLGDRPVFDKLAATYRVPQHVQVIMKHIKGRSGDLPDTTKCWSFAKSLHGSILSALFHAETPREQEILTRYYGLYKDIGKICDFGDIGKLVKNAIASYRKKDASYVNALEMDLATDIENLVQGEDKEQTELFFSRSQKQQIRDETLEDEDDQDEEDREHLRTVRKTARGKTMVILEKEDRKRKAAIVKSRKAAKAATAASVGNRAKKADNGLISLSSSTVSDGRLSDSDVDDDAEEVIDVNASRNMTQSAPVVAEEDKPTPEDKKRKATSLVESKAGSAAAKKNKAPQPSKEIPSNSGDSDDTDDFDNSSSKKKCAAKQKASNGNDKGQDVDGIVDLTEDEDYDKLMAAAAEEEEERKRKKKKKKSEEAGSSSKENSREAFPDQSKKKQTVLSFTKATPGSSSSLFSLAIKRPVSTTPKTPAVSTEHLSALFPNPQDLQNPDSDAFHKKVFCVNVPDFTEKVFQTPAEAQHYDEFTSAERWGVAPVDAPVMMLKDLVAHLKPHQREGVRFLWKNTIGTYNREGLDYGLAEALQTDNDGRRRGPIRGKFGCLLAHCMGLGKTFTIVAFTTTVMCSPELRIIDPDLPASPIEASNEAIVPLELLSVPQPLKQSRRLISTVLVLAPVNTLRNWALEYQKWFSSFSQKERSDVTKVMNVQVIEASTATAKRSSVMQERLQKIRKWSECGGVLIMGYPLFVDVIKREKSASASFSANVFPANLSSASVKANSSSNVKVSSSKAAANEAEKSFWEEAKRLLLRPDMVVCDEVHLIKNNNGAGSKAIRQILTHRRIGLTGSPLQNNLMEYWTMMDWVRPGFLGNMAFFKSRFEKPITDGQNIDACKEDVHKMKQRAYILNKKLKDVADRKDLTVLSKDLPPKRLFVVSLRMSPLQSFLYKVYIDKCARRAMGRPILFAAYQTLLKVWNHPAALVLETVGNERTKQEAEKKQEKKKSGQKMQVLVKPATIDMRRLIAELDQVRQVCLVKGDAILGRCKDVEMVKMDTVGVRGSDSDGEEDDEEEDEDYDKDEEEDEEMDEAEAAEAAEDEASSMHSADDENAGIMLDETQSETQSETLDDDPPGGDAMDTDEHQQLGPAKEEDERDDSIDKDWWRMRDHRGAQDELVPSTPRDIIEMGAKVQCFLQLLAHCCNCKEKMLLFSSSIPTLDFLEMVLSGTWGDNVGISPLPELRDKGQLFRDWKKDIKYMRIDGKTEERQTLIDKFNKSDKMPLFLLSTRAANMGINLQSANRIVIFDTSWNPVNDLQALHRSYRYGQTKNVYVYRLLVRGSMEEKIYKKQIVKQVINDTRYVSTDPTFQHTPQYDFKSAVILNPPKPSPPPCASHLVPPRH